MCKNRMLLGLRRLNERGTVLPMFAMSLVVVTAALGASIDFGRALSTKMELQNALDAALMSGVTAYRDSRNWQTSKSQAAAVFRAHFDGASVNGSCDQTVAAVAFTESDAGLSGSACIKSPAPFIGLFHSIFSGSSQPNTYSVSVVSSAQAQGGRSIEVAVMIDVTGSMAAFAGTSDPCSLVSNPRTRMDHLKCAGEDLLDILLPSSGVFNDKVRVGIAPFASNVNAGQYASKATGLPNTGSYSGPPPVGHDTFPISISSTASSFTVTGAFDLVTVGSNVTISAATIPAYNRSWTVATSTPGRFTVNRAGIVENATATVRIFQVQHSGQLIRCVSERIDTSGNTIRSTGSTLQALNYTDSALRPGRYIGPMRQSGNIYSATGDCTGIPEVLPITNSREDLMDVFSRSTPTGATAGHLGTAWASYLLSPVLNDSLFSLPEPPASYDDRSVLKAAILMTDGEYNTLTFNGGSAANTSPRQALEQCRAMRSRGIKVYSIGMGFPLGSQPPKPNIEQMSEAERVTPLTTGSSTSRVLDMLAKCASDSKSYFFPYDGTALRTAFKVIATDVKCFLEVCNARLTN